MGEGVNVVTAEADHGVSISELYAPHPGSSEPEGSVLMHDMAGTGMASVPVRLLQPTPPPEGTENPLLSSHCHCHRLLGSPYGCPLPPPHWHSAL